MSKAVHAARRLVLGRALRSERLGEQSLSKRLALPIFASDPLSSVAYATQEILLILSLGGLADLYLTPYLGAAVVVLLAVFVLSYRQVVFAYPSGGGSYDVANRNPRKVITIYIPEYVGHWWENLLHNQSALRLEGRLLYTPGVMVTSIPWLLDSAQRIRDPAPLPAPGDIRRGALPAKSSPPDIRK